VAQTGLDCDDVYSGVASLLTSLGPTDKSSKSPLSLIAELLLDNPATFGGGCS
jgi:hypothetical protein